ncbi:hypothetical protein BX600DRAFT_414859 [Xylariales sp. PMI_506]|nr:hypothetical protein BX600DRAFT_414859 [Xylariales sp. PMI_506]
MATVTYTEIELLTPKGPERRLVSTAPPRLPTADEIPLIDLTPINGDADARKQLAAKFKAAAENTGFFYIYNHGISDELIQSALTQAKSFFNQSLEEKEKIAYHKSGEKLCGFHGVGSTQINNKETRDNKETFSMRYDSRLDPGNDGVQPGFDSSVVSEDFIWHGTSHLEGFRPILVEFWQQRLALARKLVRIFALALDLPEDYFDKVITHPGADAVHVHYPGTESIDAAEEIDVGLGSHTDIQCVTLLWQDMSGGLQVLSSGGEWLNAQPIEGTLVINIGDFLQRLSNNRFRSTVHRVYNRQKAPRYSMPFFLGFNPESICEVVPTCVDEDHPALYEPISCGKWHRDRLELAQRGGTKA